MPFFLQERAVFVWKHYNIFSWITSMDLIVLVFQHQDLLENFAQYLQDSYCCLKDRVKTQNKFSQYLLQHSVKPQIGICWRFGSQPRFVLGLNIKYVTKLPKCLKESLKIGVEGNCWQLLPCEMGQGRKDWLQNTCVPDMAFIIELGDKSTANVTFLQAGSTAVPGNLPATQLSVFIFLQGGWPWALYLD